MQVFRFHPPTDSEYQPADRIAKGSDRDEQAKSVSNTDHAGKLLDDRESKAS
jgi:hypothetical protein